MENTPQEANEKAFTQDVKPKKSLLLPLVVLQTLIIVLLSAFLIYQNWSSLPFSDVLQLVVKDDGTETEEETKTPDTSAPATATTTSPYAGTYLSGVLPTGWRIVEYTNNTGSDMLMDGTVYSGLVGLKVFNQNDVEMFHIKAVDGIGGTEGCDTVYRFSDSDQAYIDHGNDWTLATGIVPSNVVDLTNSTYTEYELLGWEVRRVGDDLYRNMNPNLPGFNPACGIDVHLTITNLAYYRQTPNGPAMANTYYMAISDTVDSSQLEELDEVLESLSVN